MQNQQTSENRQKYYIGLDIGTDSVGYAAADPTYKLLRHGGEPLIGTHLIDAAETAAERRGYRTARRRLDRRQQRVHLIRELFASEIARVDEDFYRRLDSSALWQEDKLTPSRNSFFNDPGYTDRDYHKAYPTIHHLICELIRDPAPHDVRLVYLAVAYLTAHRGHFLNQVDPDDIEGVLNFETVYEAFTAHMTDRYEAMPWSCDTGALADILKKKIGVSAKEKELTALCFGGKKPKCAEGDLYDRALLVKLLAGGTVKPDKLFLREDYAEIPSISLSMKEESFDAALTELEDEQDRDLLLCAKKLYDWSLLTDLMRGHDLLSEAKIIEVYKQHEQDLKLLKHFIRTYRPDKYAEVFRSTTQSGNYVAYAYHEKSGADRKELKKATKQDFCDYILKLVRNIDVREEDRAAYEDMLARLDKDVCTFMPKQSDGDNRVIPYQLYYTELKQILDTACAYLPFLTVPDQDGLTPCDKILSVFLFRIPYFVGPLNPADPRHSWIRRRAEGKIYPWNFESLVDFDASEEAFINRMTNTCTYLPGEPVLAQNSLLYERFMVLNEINNIKINGEPIPVSCKKRIFNECFLVYARVTRKKIEGILRSACDMRDGDTLTGLDATIKASLKSYHFFKPYIEAGQLGEDDVEWILDRKAYCEDNLRFRRNLRERFPALPEDVCRRIANQAFKGFGRLSRALLCELKDTDRETGEVMTIMEALWDTNQNLMELFSDRYTFREQAEARARDYYAANPQSLSERLEEMAVSNAVKRPIIRALDIVRDVVKVTGRPPAKIFVEMARGEDERERLKKDKQRERRRERILQFYKAIDNDTQTALLAGQLANIQEDRRLRNKSLFLYFMQLGKCMYCQSPIEIDRLGTGEYDIDHIHPQSFVKDDSLDNMVLVCSVCNKRKDDHYPIAAEVQHKMSGFWHMLQDRYPDFYSEKYKRLTRRTAFTDEERWGFINRQLVETRQSTKAVATLLKETYHETEIVYVKAGLVSEYRQEFGLLKSRSVNDLHHAKDAYLNIVVGNVYHSVFTRTWFFKRREDISVKVKTLFGWPRYANGELVWNGVQSMALVRKTMEKDHIHLTRYAFCRHGGFFDQMPRKAGENDTLVPRKKGLDPQKYGGYNKTTATYFILVKFRNAKKSDLMIMPVELLYAKPFEADPAYAAAYATRTIATITGKEPTEVTFPLGMRKIKVNTVLELDGFRYTLSGKSGGGRQLCVSSLTSLHIGRKWEVYIKHLDSFAERKRDNPLLHVHARHDKITKEENCELYEIYMTKLRSPLFFKPLGESIVDYLEKGKDIFASLSVEKQVDALINIIALLKTGRKNGCDLSAIEGKPTVGVLMLSSQISNWKKKYTAAYIIDTSASGLYESRSPNLFDLL